MGVAASSGGLSIMPSASRPRVVWHFTDGKSGHDNQSRGLLRALSARLPLQSHTIEVPEAPRRSCWRQLADFLQRRCIVPAHLPPPDLLLGTGHATHIAMLAARHARGGRIIVLMKPSLPVRCFDLCVVPHHDAVSVRANVFVTRGPLNSIVPASRKLERQGLILIGGESKHYRWTDQPVLEQIIAIAQDDAAWRWTMVGSRRTPRSIVAALAQMRLPNLAYVAVCDTGTEWLPFRLAEAARAWVTEDSLSMVYEALSCGAAVGALAVPRRRFGRVSNDIDQLCAEGLLTTFSEWRQGRPLQAPPQVLREADRCAQWIVDNFLQAS